MTLRAALILAGAAAKGPYAAGVLSQLAKDHRAEIVAIAGASSGALNGAVYAAGLRAGQPEEAARLLGQLWVEDASWHKIVSWKKRKQIVLDALQGFRGRSRQRPILFRAVVASLPGRRDEFGRRRFEQSEIFRTEDFENTARLEHMAEMCLASAALPVIFSPRQVAGQGPFWDGGIVDNAPIGWAVKDATIDHVIVATPDSDAIEPRHYGRFSVSRLIDMLIDERLSRDLHEAESFNAELARLDAKLDALEAQLGAEQLGAVCPGERLATQVRRELNWRTLSFLEIRPPKDLDGNQVVGFLSKSLRRRYLQAGHDAAKRQLGDWQPGPPAQPPAPTDGWPPAPAAPQAQAQASGNT
jgi:predicted acylesterase/phospholipase RssA